MKLSDYKGTDAVELLADLLEPIGKLFEDEELTTMFRNMKDHKKMDMVRLILKKHSKEVVEIMAIIDGEDVATYSPNFYALPTKLLDLFNDEEFMNLFISQGQNAIDQPFGSATETTAEDEIG